MSNVEIQERAPQIMVISGLNPKDKKPSSRLKGRLSERFYKFATRDWRRRYGVNVYHRRPDYRTIESLKIAREQLSREIQEENIDILVGSSAGGNEALRLAYQLNKIGVSNQGRLRQGGKDDLPTLAEAAKYHEGFYSAVTDFEDDILTKIP